MPEQALSVLGLIVGGLARLVRPGEQNLSVWPTLGIGSLGSVLGRVVANLLGTGDIWELNVFGFVVAVIAAIVFAGSPGGWPPRDEEGCRRERARRRRRLASPHLDPACSSSSLATDPA